MKLSYTRLNTLLECGQKFKFKYIDNFPELDSEKRIYAVGSELHKLISAKLLRQPYLSEFPWLEEIANNVIETLEKVTHIVGSEVHFTANYNGLEFEGVIDIIGRDPEGYTVFDIKTGAGNIIQTQVYAYFLELLKNVKVHRVGLAKVNTNTREVTVIHESYDRDQAEQWLQKAVRKLQSQQFAPEPGPACQFCSYFYICQLADLAFQKKLMDLSLEQRIDLYAYVRRFLDTLEDTLKPLVADGPIETEKYRVMLQVTEYLKANRKFTENDYQRLFEKYGLAAFTPDRKYLLEEFPNDFVPSVRRTVKFEEK